MTNSSDGTGWTVLCRLETVILAMLSWTSHKFSADDSLRTLLIPHHQPSNSDLLTTMNKASAAAPQRAEIFQVDHKPKRRRKCRRSRDGRRRRRPRPLLLFAALSTTRRRSQQQRPKPCALRLDGASGGRFPAAGRPCRHAVIGGRGRFGDLACRQGRRRADSSSSRGRRGRGGGGRRGGCSREGCIDGGIAASAGGCCCRRWRRRWRGWGRGRRAW